MVKKCIIWHIYLYTCFIHPSICFLDPWCPFWGRRAAEGYRSYCWMKMGYTLKTFPVYCRATHSHTSMTWTPRANLESPIDLWCLFLDCGRKPGTCKLHTQISLLLLNQGLLAMRINANHYFTISPHAKADYFNFHYIVLC